MFITQSREREWLLIYLMQGLSLCAIARLPGRNKSTISRELVRNGDNYLPSCSRWWKVVSSKSTGRPNKSPIASSSKDTPEQKRSEGNRGARRYLRRKGKPRRPKGYVSNRGEVDSFRQQGSCVGDDWGFARSTIAQDNARPRKRISTARRIRVCLHYWIKEN